jgi:hypothetical protein
MENLTRENKEFWEGLTQELTKEINEKGLLTEYINVVKNQSEKKKKEDGHSYAQSYVDFLVASVMPKCETLNKYGFTIEDSIKEREHGDFYLVHQSSGSKILISSNGKLGLADKMGQPNMCSIERAIDYLHEKNLPYLVFKLRKVKTNFIFKVFDLFNYVDVISYNDGPGQLMISESKFFKKKEFKYLKTSEALLYLFDIHERAYESLFVSRTKRLNKFRNIRKQYERDKI